jgi:hypothetical protein
MARRLNRGTPRKKPPKRPAHRPAHAPTDQLRALVKQLRIDGHTEDKVAEALDIDPKTLRKHYRAELDASKRNLRLVDD